MGKGRWWCTWEIGIKRRLCPPIVQGNFLYLCFELQDPSVSFLGHKSPAMWISPHRVQRRVSETGKDGCLETFWDALVWENAGQAMLWQFPALHISPLNPEPKHLSPIALRTLAQQRLPQSCLMQPLGTWETQSPTWKQGPWRPKDLKGWTQVQHALLEFIHAWTQEFVAICVFFYIFSVFSLFLFISFSFHGTFWVI